jgi:hypothetical protein
LSSVQEEVPIEVLEQRREELSVLLNASSLMGAFESHLAHQKDPQATWTYRFYRAVELLQASKAEAPLAVFSKVVKVRLSSGPVTRQSVRVCCGGRGYTDH